ncbi:MAG TPA: 2-phospho-L-lactate transferase [Micropepsaceae bacterium]|nr:2-phospho-L-lactate transferase [Micropepsaceae bacterium]
MRIAALAGGVGGSKLVLGLYQVMDPRDLTVIANTGDDVVMHGLHVSPDPDILIYTLADLVNPETGWGFRGETFNVAEGLSQYGRPTWFQLGDRDLATHIHRSAMLGGGATLSQVIESIRMALGVKTRILPMSDQFVPTMLDTDEGRMHLQDYFVRRRCEPALKSIEFAGIAGARPAPGVIETIEQADGIIITPSNPLISIDPILAVPGLRAALCRRREQVVAVCPLVGGKSLKGPSDRMMAQLGYDVSAAGVAQLYQDFCSTMVIDDADADQSSALKTLDVKPIVCPTVMRTLADKEQLARVVLRVFESNAV